MKKSDTGFAGSIPANYDKYLVPLIFQPYAVDLAERASHLLPKDVLEIAAGTGVVTAELVRQLDPETRLTVTDLNQAMLDVAAAKISAANISFATADASSLQFADESFDAVLCQFGAMFFPDKVKAYREARRVLRPGGHFLFNVWGALERNEITATIDESLQQSFPGKAPQFFRRAPHSYYDAIVIRDELSQAGFENVEIIPLFKRSIAPDPGSPAMGFFYGCPLHNEIMALDPSKLDSAAAAATAALEKRYGSGPIEGALEAIVVDGRR